MAKFFNKILDYICFDEEEEDVVQEESSFTKQPEQKTIDLQDYDKTRKKKKADSNKVVSMNRTQQSNNLIIYRPTSCDDSSYMIDSLKEKKPVIANFENIDHEKAQRILDMMSGAMYAISGTVHKVSKNIYVFAPDIMEVSGDGKDVSNINSIFMSMGQ